VVDYQSAFEMYLLRQAFKTTCAHDCFSGNFQYIDVIKRISQRMSDIKTKDRHKQNEVQIKK